VGQVKNFSVTPVATYPPVPLKSFIFEISRKNTFGKNQKSEKISKLKEFQWDSFSEHLCVGFV